MTIAEIIKTEREKAGWSQKRLAESLVPPTTRNYITNIEQGRSCSIVRANAILAPLGKKITLLVEEI